MKRLTKIILIVCGICLISKTVDKMKEEKMEVPSDISTVNEAKVIGMTTTAHTNESEQYYGLASWNWSYADIYTYSNGWCNVMYYVQGQEKPVSTCWIPAHWYGGA